MKKLAYSIMIAALGSSIHFYARAQIAIDSTKLGSLSLGKISNSGQKISENRLYIYPNPTSGRTDITLKIADTRGFSLELYDSLGMRLLYQEWKGGVLDVSPYPPGVYLLTLRREKETYTQKLMIER